MKIIFLPKYKSLSEIHLDSIQLEKQYPGISEWEYGEVKDIDEEIIVDLKSFKTYLTDLLLSNNNFRPFIPELLYDVLKNPNFHCCICGEFTEQEVFQHPTQFPNSVSLWIDDDRFCKKCFDENTIFTPTGFEKKPINEENT